ncbi:hypothetical protein BABINDRAFT_168360 [Babjeviella inositovora NRRL Y-12698]|uniref:LYC1 C-terminal domain-containing protein n=1 Tax=Babjeviella inositovora NRRL Y-12698 TaxID=984486 RepID=A0A1E3QKM3_9ASCO|nr:uncharacterized protein BABINDRAFT_168360 [Babjeviella inositovora NRRL Y-12698]ODQ78168.1 hypothetical protein BABINDRAFT_168360 [Babjeviella inositovora NRRL Y-12698]
MIMKNDRDCIAAEAIMPAQPATTKSTSAGAKKDISNYTFERTFNPEIIRNCHALNSHAWSNELTPEQYVEREKFMSTVSLSNVASEPHHDGTSVNGFYNLRKGPQAAGLAGIAYYIVRDLTAKRKEGDDDMFDVACACETLTRLSYIAHPGSDGEAIITNVMSPCIGGVFVPAKSRGLNLGNIMINKLIDYLNNEYATSYKQRLSAGNPKGETYSTLYSEVGEYYRKFGYISRGMDLITVDYTHAEVPATSAYTFKAYKVKDDTTLLHKLHNDQVLRQLALAVKTTGFKQISNTPTLENFNWHCFRSIFISNNLKVFGETDSKDELVFAVSMYDPSNPEKIVAMTTFTHDWKNRNIYILKIVLVEPQTSADASMKLIDELFQQIRRESHVKYGDFHKINLWQSELFQYGIDSTEQFAQVYADKNGVDASKVAISVSENGSISAARFHNYAESEDGKVEIVEENISVDVPFGWIDNGKWCWF